MLNHPEKNGGDSSEQTQRCLNPHLRQIKEDTLYHIGLTSGKQDLKKMFGDVKVSHIISNMAV